VAGVFLTHLHPDHLTGMADVAAGTPVHAGPGEASERGFVNVFLQPNIDRALAGKGLLSAWPFAPEVDGAFEGVVDIFGDGSAWALWVPGHTGGSTAYLLRTPRGPVLLTGDACHTRWGWDHAVEPGSFSSDVPHSAESLARLQRLVAEHPGVEVRLGHQR
jgi:glyoxylase-like metal-dependent hydrolase (beta-lactamase superfamily II)